MSRYTSCVRGSPLTSGDDRRIFTAARVRGRFLVAETAALVAMFLVIHALALGDDQHGDDSVELASAKGLRILALPTLRTDDKILMLGYASGGKSSAAILRYHPATGEMKTLPWEVKHNFSRGQCFPSSGKFGIFTIPGPPGQGQVVRLDLDNGQTDVLFRPAEGWMLFKASVSLDGQSVSVVIFQKKIQEELNENSEARLSVLRLGGEPSQRMVWGGIAWIDSAYWAPNSKSMAWIVLPHDKDVALLFAQVGDLRKEIIPPPEGEDIDLFGGWAPDSNRILYSHWEEKPHRLQLRIWDLPARANETLCDMPEGLKPNWGFDSAPRWSPDGKWIAFPARNFPQEGQRKVEELWLIASDGSKKVVLGSHSLTPDEEESSRLTGWWGCPFWSADGKSIMFVRGNSLRNLNLRR